MARKRRTQKPPTSDERDDYSPSLTQLLHPSIPQKQKPLTAFSPSPEKMLKNTLREIEDRRTWHPQGAQRPARSVTRSQHKLVLPKKDSSPRLPSRVAFDAPKQVLVCIRRKMRKEVLFAKRKTWKGSRARRHRHTYFSEVTC